MAQGTRILNDLLNVNLSGVIPVDVAVDLHISDLTHNNLQGLQGGQSGEFYHLSYDIYNTLINNGDASALHHHDDLYYQKPEVDNLLYFYKLLDTPSNYSGYAGYSVRVNSTEDGLEFFVPAGGTDGKSKIDSSDILEYLEDKLLADSPISITKEDQSGYKKLKFTFDTNALIHNNLSGLQGGSSGEYYHLTEIQYNTLTDGNDASSLHNHSSLYYTKSEVDNLIQAYDTFLELIDTPNDYTGNAGKAIRVNNTEDGLEFYTPTITDEKVKTSSNDAVAGYLEDKFDSDSFIDITKQSTSGNEVLYFSFNPGNIDHGSISGLDDDDHPQYLNNSRGDARYYKQSQVDNLLDQKEDYLGLPSSNGQILSSDTSGNRSWIDRNIFDYVDFNPLSTPPSHKEGRVYYNDIEKTLTYQTDITGVELNIGREFSFLVYNDTSATIPNGSVVYFTGSHVDGNAYIITVDIADIDDPQKFTRVLGIATNDIGPNESGYVTRLGCVHDLDTSSFNVGDPLYLANNGALTNHPESSKAKVFVGIATKIDSNNGIVEALTLSYKLPSQIYIDPINAVTGGNGDFGIDTTNDIASIVHYASGWSNNNDGYAKYFVKLPLNFKSIVSIHIKTKVSADIDSYTLTLSKGGTADPSINGVDIEPSSTNTWEDFEFTPSGSYSPGDIIMIKVQSQVDSGDYAYATDIYLDIETY